MSKAALNTIPGYMVVNLPDCCATCVHFVIDEYPSIRSLCNSSIMRCANVSHEIDNADLSVVPNGLCPNFERSDG